MTDKINTQMTALVAEILEICKKTEVGLPDQVINVRVDSRSKYISISLKPNKNLTIDQTRLLEESIYFLRETFSNHLMFIVHPTTELYQQYIMPLITYFALSAQNGTTFAFNLKNMELT